MISSRPDLSCESPAFLTYLKTRVAGITIVNFLHFFDRIEEADDEGRTKGFSRPDRSAAKFLDQADITALVAAGFIDHRGVEGHSREPGTFAAVFGIAKVIGANKPFGHRIRISAIIEFFVGRKVFDELGRWNPAGIA